MVTLPFHSPDGYRSVAASDAAADGFWFIFRGERLLVEVSSNEDGGPRVPSGAPPSLVDEIPRHHLGELGGRPCFAAEVPDHVEAPPGASWEGLRGLFSTLHDAHLSLAGRALQIVDWDRTHRFCGRCGTPTEPKPDERVRVCPACRLSVYPRVAPAIMAIVREGRRILLARGARFAPGMYSALAGFVEPGESLEQCVEREVEEEVGLRVKNLRYFASQPWPFPHSLMIAFTCERASGEIRPQPGEIEEALWFDVFQLPKLPGKISIARSLIDAAVEAIRSEP